MRGPIPPLPLYAFMAWCLVKDRDNFTFILCDTVAGTEDENGEHVYYGSQNTHFLIKIAYLFFNCNYFDIP
jgi:hypothetical protein